MWAISVVVDKKLVNQSEQVLIVEHDDIVEAFASESANVAFDLGVLQGRSQGRHDLGDVHGPQTAGDLFAEDRVVVSDEEAWRGVVRERLTQLPLDPRGGQVRRDVEVHDTPSIVPNATYCRQSTSELLQPKSPARSGMACAFVVHVPIAHVPHRDPRGTHQDDKKPCTTSNARNRSNSLSDRDLMRKSSICIRLTRTTGENPSLSA